MKKYIYKKALFVFRRDLRVDDNVGLHAACAQAQTVVPCFVIDPEQATKKNRYRSMNALQFMLESLSSLDEQLKKRKGRLYVLCGSPHVVIEKLIKQEAIDAVFFNRDYTPYSTKRDSAIKKVCDKHHVVCESFTDVVLYEPGVIAKDNGTPYTVFTPFFKKAVCRPVEQPRCLQQGHFFAGPLRGSQKLAALNKLLAQSNKNLAVHGGRDGALAILKHLEVFKNYAKEHDVPALAQTTMLSAHLKFGTCSIREALYAIKKTLGFGHPLIRQLYWREFFTHVAFHFPHVYGHSFRQSFARVLWANNQQMFKAWCDGKTGFPIVDAGMRQLNATGFMHNRVRMIVASFLAKDLHIDWRKGEHYFATKLVDYDPAVNNGNWQWAASTGADAQPYFRIFNPWLQQKKFDRNCDYIKQWVPELAKLTPKQIHAWFSYSGSHPSIRFADANHSGRTGALDQGIAYPRPIVDHAEEAAKAKKLYAASLKRNRD